jgi:putative DNA-invertase from lambdoid prophage Rac
MQTLSGRSALFEIDQLRTPWKTCPKIIISLFRTQPTIRTWSSNTYQRFQGFTMSRVFAYCRVSTTDQHTDNQRREIEAAGFSITAVRTVAEAISGSVAAFERPGFAKLMDRMEEGDVLVVTKLDRLGRNAMDVRATVERLAGSGVRVHCLALGGVDLTSAAGKMTMGVLTAVAEFERDLLIERTQSGLARAKAEGKTLGRKPVLDSVKQTKVLERLAKGESVAQLARDFDTTRQTIMRVREAGAAAA